MHVCRWRMTHARRSPRHRHGAIAFGDGGSVRAGTRARPPSAASAAAPSTCAIAPPRGDTPRCSTALAGATVQTTRRSLSADTAVGVALAFGKDLPDRGMGSREGLASRRVKSRRRAFTSPSRRRHASFAARSPASRPTLRESLSPGPVQTAQASRRSWTGSAPPKWTSFKPAVTSRDTGAGTRAATPSIGPPDG